MGYCAICGTHYDAQAHYCGDRGGDVLPVAGIERSHMPENELKETVKKADRAMLRILIVIGAMLVAAILLSILTSRLY
jgi:hypothetical protein